MTKYLISIFLALSAPVCWAAGDTPLETKLALENSLEKRLTQILSEALGTEDIIVIISADMQEQNKKSMEIMPGIPVKEKMGEISLSSTLTMVKKLSANIILDKSVTEEDTKLAIKLAAGLLGLPPDRQDLINVEKMNFRKARPISAADLLAPPNIWNLLWLLGAAVLAAAAIFIFLSPLAKTARAFVEAFSAKTFAPAEAAHEREETREKPAEAQEKAREAAATADGRKPPFWFLASANPANLAFIMKSRPKEELTIVLSYAQEELASKLAELLYPASVEALAALPSVKLIPEAQVRKLETELQNALDYVIGGENKALNILNRLDESVQDKALSAFTRLDPLMAKKLSASVVRFSDISRLQPAQAQALARRVPIRVLASALKTSTFVEAFVNALSAGMQERFRQELELTRPMPAEAYRADRAKVVDALRGMAADGFMTPKGESVASVAAKKPLGQIPGLPPLPGGAPSAPKPGLAPAAPKPAGPAPAAPPNPAAAPPPPAPAKP